jgi:hypothetical protein
VSGEVEAADQLDKISSWCVRSLKYLDTQRDVFDKRFFGAFDRFLAEGNELLSSNNNEDSPATIHLDDKAVAEKLNTSWKAFVSDQLKRLDTLVVDRERFISWCDKSDEVLNAGEKQRPTLDKLKELSEQSRDFPSGTYFIEFVNRFVMNTLISNQIISQCAIWFKKSGGFTTRQPNGSSLLPRFSRAKKN